MKGKNDSGVDCSRNRRRRSHWRSDALNGHLDLYWRCGRGRDWRGIGAGMGEKQWRVTGGRGTQAESLCHAKRRGLPQSKAGCARRKQMADPSSSRHCIPRRNRPPPRPQSQLQNLRPPCYNASVGETDAAANPLRKNLERARGARSSRAAVAHLH